MDKVSLKEIVIKGKCIKSGNRPLVCVPLMGDSENAVMEHATRILDKAKCCSIDIVEFRADYYNDIQDLTKLGGLVTKLQELFKDKIFLFTIRSPKEGGEKREYEPHTIEEINRFIIDNKLSDMVDVELYSVEGEESSLISLAKEKDVKIIMSNHDFEKTPAKEDMVNRLVRMQQLGADIVKLAVMPNSKDDLNTLLTATMEMNVSHGDTPIVTMSMGEIGAFSRIAGEVYGSAFTFGAVGEVSAPGQLGVEELNNMLDMIHRNCV